MTNKLLLALLTVVAAAGPAYAQQPAAPPPAQPMQIETIQSGFVIAPDSRFTQIDDRTATFAGAYGGYLAEKTFLVGAGGYWLANEDHDFKMAYGGAVIGWTIRCDHAFAYGARVLVGGGEATLSSSYAQLLNIPDGTVVSTRDVARFGSRHGSVNSGISSSTRVIVTDDFFITEPQANVLWRLTDWMRIDLGVSYRVIAASDFMDSRLRGFGGTVAIRFGQ